MKNKAIRQYAIERGVYLYQIAERLGMNDGNFSRKLRKELSPDERTRVISLIDDIAKEAADIE